MKKLLPFLLALMLPFTAMAVETDISQKAIGIRYEFDGADLLIFGAVDSSDIQDKAARFDIVVIVRGPDQEVTLRKKEKVAGIWVNKTAHVFASAPGFYSVVSSRPLDEIVSEETQEELKIGYKHLPLLHKTSEGKTQSEFIAALVRGKEANELYSSNQTGVKFSGKYLFRADVRLPANVPVGDFEADIYLFQHGQLKAQKKVDMSVNKVGFERAVYNYAHDWPFFYGLTAVFIALGAGWIAGTVGKK